MDYTERMEELMKRYFVDRIPMLYYENHSSIRFWYDTGKNSLCAECGVEVPVTISEDNFTKSELRKLIKQLDHAVIEYYEARNIKLLHNRD